MEGCYDNQAEEDHYFNWLEMVEGRDDKRAEKDHSY